MKKITLVALLIGLLFCSCGGGGNSSTGNDDFAYNADSVMVYLNASVNQIEGVSYEVSDLDKSTCRIRVTIPESRGQEADAIGTAFCTLAARWMAEKGFDLGPGISITCYVYSPHTGTTGRPDMVTRWGRARYDTFTDSVKWEWEK